jgi:histidyl-tRNA synthetase
LSAKGGQDIKNEIYYFKDKSDRELGLRFDFTVPFARILGSNPSLVKPFRRYQIGPVWRYDRPGSGRYREFWQADIDIAGASTGESDALCIAAACDAMKSLGFTEFFVRVNNRKIIEAFLISVGLKEKVIDVMRSIDKLEKIGEKKVSDELNEKKIESQKIKKILEFIKIKNLADAKKLVEGYVDGREGVKELEVILDFIESLGFSEFVKFDISLVRGLEYYTGPVFEINAGINVSVGGGGRYDNMIESFGGKPTPATGISVGIDRIVLAMEEKKLFRAEKTKTKVYIAAVSESCTNEIISLSRKFISSSIPTEFNTMRRNLRKELEYANVKGIPFVVVIGENEVKSKKAKLRNMASGEEKEFSIENPESIIKILGKN